MKILLHPTHRKFIKLLRSYVKRCTIITITDQDFERFMQVIHRTNISMERHRASYKIMLEILNRKPSPENGYLLSNEFVDKIEEFLAEAERRKLCNTIKIIILKPIIRFMKRRLRENN